MGSPSLALRGDAGSSEPAIVLGEPFFDHVNPAVEQRISQKVQLDAKSPRISAWALLQLAQWCEERRSTQHGGDACLTTPAIGSPPIGSRVNTTHSPEPTLAALIGASATATLPSAQSADCQTAPSCSPEGGVR